MELVWMKEHEDLTTLKLLLKVEFLANWLRQTCLSATEKTYLFKWKTISWICYIWRKCFVGTIQ
jgi:hypothetical protein